MAKKLKVVVKLNITAGKANPAPPIGPALAQHGINLMAFCKDYTARTASMAGQIIPAEISIYTDNSFTFVLKTSPTPDLLRKAAGVEKGSSTPNKQKVAKVTRRPAILSSSPPTFSMLQISSFRIAWSGRVPTPGSPRSLCGRFSARIHALTSGRKAQGHRV